jgi:hypothetical protein
MGKSRNQSKASHATASPADSGTNAAANLLDNDPNTNKAKTSDNPENTANTSRSPADKEPVPAYSEMACLHSPAPPAFEEVQHVALKFNPTFIAFVWSAMIICLRIGQILVCQGLADVDPVLVVVTPILSGI